MSGLSLWSRHNVASSQRSTYLDQFGVAHTHGSKCLWLLFLCRTSSFSWRDGLTNLFGSLTPVIGVRWPLSVASCLIWLTGRSLLWLLRSCLLRPLGGCLLWLLGGCLLLFLCREWLPSPATRLLIPFSLGLLR